MMIVSKNYGDDAMNLKKITAALLCMLMLSACGNEVKSEGAAYGGISQNNTSGEPEVLF